MGGTGVGVAEEGRERVWVMAWEDEREDMGVVVVGGGGEGDLAMESGGGVEGGTLDEVPIERTVKLDCDDRVNADYGSVKVMGSTEVMGSAKDNGQATSDVNDNDGVEGSNTASAPAHEMIRP
ncbi:hypothetical protein Syun_025427 [Stephania yunnanensis]|uniref:Uncharacterized protein n=1 Tax=Stephania yunnanensis TaxID=152371 RepID=A0AAP0HUV5_9MAGN